MKMLPPLLLALALPLAALADASPDPDPADCDARARLAAERLEKGARGALRPAEVGAAQQAVFESCMRGDAPTAAEATAGEPEKSGFARFVAGLFSADAEPAKKRSGKYRYIEKE